MEKRDDFDVGRYVWERAVAVLGVAVGMGLYRWWTGH
jgi:hypothetical protein